MLNPTDKKLTLLFTLALSIPFVLGAGQDAKPVETAKPAKKADAQKSEAKPTHAKADPMKYVGTETCKTCHEDQHKAIQSVGFHWKNDSSKKFTADVGQGCESCHGPGRDHAESGGDIAKIISFKSLPPAKASQVCLDCHQNSQEHINFQRSIHNDSKVGCTDCHSVHKPEVKVRLLKAAQPQLCFGCHADARADFMKPFHHRVMEKLVKCTDCHNPHGGFLAKQVRSTPAQDAVCFGCHSEKAGPFVFEHAPSKIEGCVACHTPHGSSNPRLLKRSQVNLLCLECHTFTVDSVAPAAPSFHNQAQKYQACTMCHSSIHGSNFSKVFFK